METSVNNRILGIDFGKKYVGLAISDPLLITAQPLNTVFRKRPDKFRSTIAEIRQICESRDVEAIVIGMPKNLDGTENERCVFTREFADLLFEKLGIPIYFWDERLTTVSSDKELEFMGVKDKKAHSDEMAAMMILQGYMDSVKNGVICIPYLS